MASSIDKKVLTTALMNKSSRSLTQTKKHASSRVLKRNNAINAALDAAESSTIPGLADYITDIPIENRKNCRKNIEALNLAAAALRAHYSCHEGQFVGFLYRNYVIE